jgi:hypothetical protein
MERVTNNKLLIGFSCGNQFVMTPAIAFKVKIFLNLYSFIEILIYISDVSDFWSFFHFDP